MDIEDFWTGVISAGIIAVVLFVVLSLVTGPLFTGIHIKSGEGQYVGYVTAVEKSGVWFQGWEVYLKTDLASSNEDHACIDRNNPELIEKLKQAQVDKKNMTLEYESMMMYGLGECPGSSWMIKNVRE